VEDFVDYFADVPTLPIQVPTAFDVVGNFCFRNIDLNECLFAFGSITSNGVGVDGISFSFLKLLLPFICCHVMHVFNHAITSSVFPSSGRWLLFGQLPRLVRLLVLLTSAQLMLFLFCLRRLSAFFMIRFSSKSSIAVCCRIFSLALGVGIVYHFCFGQGHRKFEIVYG
jgi:hypothetical protein